MFIPESGPKLGPESSLKSSPKSGSEPDLFTSTFSGDPESILNWLEWTLLHQTGQTLSDLQRIILRLCLKGKRYLEIAEAYGCTEGHAKDVGAKLWRSLSQALDEKITKQNLRATAARGLNKARALKARALSNRRYRLIPPTRSSPALRLDPAAHQLFRWSWDDQADSW